MEQFRRVRAALSFGVPIPKSVRVVATGAVVLLFLFLAAGAAYTYFGEEAGDVEPVVVSERETNPIPKTTIPAANSNVGASVQMLTSPIVPGSDAAMTVRTLPGATCAITAVYNEVPDKDPGLVAKVANEYGMVDWRWWLDADVPLGKWPVTVTCSFNGRSGVVIGDLVVSATVGD